jgi:hypothetical protein
LFVLTQLTFNYAADDSGWAFHDWVLNTQGWDAYKNKYGVPVELGTVSRQLYHYLLQSSLYVAKLTLF